MKILAISGSTRANSTNSALLHNLARIAPIGIEILVFDDIISLPVFSLDLLPNVHHEAVTRFAKLAKEADGIIFAVPEYVRTIPGGLKNAIDWLVPSDELIDKPIAIIHASWRGDDMLADLRRVLATVSINFTEEIFERFAITNLDKLQIMQQLNEENNKTKIILFLEKFIQYILVCKTKA